MMARFTSFRGVQKFFLSVPVLCVLAAHAEACMPTEGAVFDGDTTANVSVIEARIIDIEMTSASCVTVTYDTIRQHMGDAFRSFAVTTCEGQRDYWAVTSDQEIQDFGFREGEDVILAVVRTPEGFRYGISTCWGPDHWSTSGRSQAKNERGLQEVLNRYN